MVLHPYRAPFVFLAALANDEGYAAQGQGEKETTQQEAELWCDPAPTDNREGYDRYGCQGVAIGNHST